MCGRDLAKLNTTILVVLVLTLAFSVPSRVQATTNIQASTVICNAGDVRYRFVGNEGLISVFPMAENVTLTMSTQPDNGGITIALDPTILIKNDLDNSAAKLTIDCNKPGMYAINVFESNNYTVVFPVKISPSTGFTVTANPSSLSDFPCRCPLNSTITVQSAGKFAGTVDLILTMSPNSPSALQCWLSSTQVTISTPGGAATSTLTCIREHTLGGGFIAVISATSTENVEKTDTTYVVIGLEGP